MPDQELTTDEFGRSFKAFMDAMIAASVPRRSPLQERIAAHLGRHESHNLRALYLEYGPCEWTLSIKTYKR